MIPASFLIRFAGAWMLSAMLSLLPLPLVVRYWPDRWPFFLAVILWYVVCTPLVFAASYIIPAPSFVDWNS